MTPNKAYGNLDKDMMKLRTTTPASLTRFTKMGITFVVAFFLVGAGIFYVINKPASADEYDRKIAALQQDMARYQAEVDRLNSEAVTLQNTLASLGNEKRALQAVLKRPDLFGQLPASDDCASFPSSEVA